MQELPTYGNTNDRVDGHPVHTRTTWHEGMDQYSLESDYRILESQYRSEDMLQETNLSHEDMENTLRTLPGAAMPRR